MKFLRPKWASPSGAKERTPSSLQTTGVKPAWEAVGGEGVARALEARGHDVVATETEELRHFRIDIVIEGVAATEEDGGIGEHRMFLIEDRRLVATNSFEKGSEVILEAHVLVADEIGGSAGTALETALEERK